MQLSGDGASSYHKSLPRLPSADEAYESISPAATPKAGLISLEPTASPNLSPHLREESHSTISTIRPSPSVRTDSANSDFEGSIKTVDTVDSVSLLDSMRQTFQRTEQALYSQLLQTPVSTLNDVRRSFYSAAVGASKRLSAWEIKHLPKESRATFANKRQTIQEPQWWHHGFHAIPGGKVVVQEEDWGSIIAFTLRLVCRPIDCDLIGLS